MERLEKEEVEWNNHKQTNPLMKEINKLQAALSPHLSWHGARIRFLALFLVALFRVRTVNLTELPGAFASRAKAESNSKRLKRFVSQFEVKQDEIAQMVVGLAGIPEPWSNA